jgi:hypothetical protein
MVSESEIPLEHEMLHSGEDVVDEGVEGAATVYEREEHKYVAEEKDFTQPQFFVAEEVKDFSHLEQQPILEEPFIERNVVDSNMAEPMIEREDVSEYREAAWQEQFSHETMRQVSETTVTEETRKISSSSDHQEQDRDSSPYSSDEDQEGVRSKEIKHHHEEETIEETNEQAIEESEEDIAVRMRAAMSAGTPPSSPVVVRGEPMHADTSLAEAAVLAQHEQQYTEEKRDEEKRSRKSSTSSVASHASSTSSKASSTKGYPLKEDVDDGEELSREEEEPRGLSQLVDDEVKQTRIQHTQSSSYDDTATTSSEPRGETGKRSRTSSSSSAKSVASNSSKASKGSVGSSRQSSGRSSKSNLEDELIQKATHVDATADEVVEQELLDEMVVKEVSEECGTDPGAGVVTDAKDVIREEDEGKQQ